MTQASSGTASTRAGARPEAGPAPDTHEPVDDEVGLGEHLAAADSGVRGDAPRPPAARPPRRPPRRAARPALATAPTPRPRRRAGPAAYSASPPLSPGPARATTTVRPSALGEPGGGTTSASPSAARCMSSPSGRPASAAVLGRTDVGHGIRLDHAQPSAMTIGRRDARRRGTGTRGTCSTPSSSGARLDGAAHVAERTAAVGVRHDSRVGPVQPGRRAEALARASFAAKRAASEASRSPRSSAREQPLRQARRALERLARSARCRRRRCRPRRSPPPVTRCAPVTASLDRDGLGEVAGLVDVETLGRRQLAGRRPAAAPR